MRIHRERGLRWPPPLIRAAALLGLLSAGTVSAAVLPPAEVTANDHGQLRTFTLQVNEVAQRLPQGGYAVEARAELRDRAALATALQAARQAGKDCALVLYEAGQPRSAFTRRLLTARLALITHPGSSPAALAARAGLRVLHAPPYAPDSAILEAATPEAVPGLCAALRALPGVVAADPLLLRQQQPRFLPDDPRFSEQWHLRNTGQTGGTAGVDLNATNAWDTATGAGVVIGIVDDGLATLHADLAPNVNAALGHDWVAGDSDPAPGPWDDHGTACAGIAAARGHNATGVCGVAYQASLAGLRLTSSAASDWEEAEALSYSNALIHIKSCSWGPPDGPYALEGPGPLTQAALAAGTRDGRDGLGTLFVWAGGNGGVESDMANKDGYANSIHTISVAALTDHGIQSAYSEWGPCHVVCAPSSGGNRAITTTDLDNGYRSDFSGTSAAAPQVAGVAALLLQANPNLGWRDVQEILMRSARRVDAADPGWLVNGAGFAFNHRYGAGLCDAGRAVALARTWTNRTEQLAVASNLTALARAIPDAASAGVSFAFDLAARPRLRVEHVTLRATLRHPARGQLAVTLRSPAGTESPLIEQNADTHADYADWTFMSLWHWGESSRGVWTATVRDKATGQTGTVEALALTVYGSAADAPTAAPIITSALVVTGFINSAFAYRITATNTPTAFDAAPLPPGLRVNRYSGLLSGVPAAPGTNTLMLTASNAVGTASAALTLIVLPRQAQPPVITSARAAAAMVGYPFVYQIEATGSPTAFSAAPLPPGLTVNTNNGSLAGTPLLAGTNQVVLGAVNGDGAATAGLTLVVHPAGAGPLNRALDNTNLFFRTGGTQPWFEQTAVTTDGVDAARSGPLADSATSWFETTVTGPAAVAFDWRVSSEAAKDLLIFAVDGSTLRSLSGEQPWQRYAVALRAGAHTLRWTYARDAAGSAGADAAWVDRVVVRPTPRVPLAQALDHYAHPWLVDAGREWLGQTNVTHDGRDAAESFPVGNGQTSDLRLDVEGPGAVTFHWRVSSEANYDYLRFAVDGTEAAAISGESGWLPASQAVAAGTHTLSWSYTKDPLASAGADAGWLDEVSYVPLDTAPGYATWLAQRFSAAEQADPALGGAHGDPDRDGYDNFFEYGLNLEPREFEATAPRFAVRIANGSVVYTYVEDLSRTDVTYGLFVGYNLPGGGWSRAGVTLVGTEGVLRTWEHRRAITRATYLKLRIQSR